MRLRTVCVCVYHGNRPVHTCSALPFSSESIRKVLDKQPVKFVRAVKQDLRSGRTEDRVLVRRRAPPSVEGGGVEVVVVEMKVSSPWNAEMEWW